MTLVINSINELNENSVCRLTISYQKPFVFSISVSFFSNTYPNIKSTATKNGLAHITSIVHRNSGFVCLLFFFFLLFFLLFFFCFFLYIYRNYID